MNNIEISYENLNKELDNKNIVKTCNNILKLLKADNWEISVVFCDDFFIRELNREYRYKDEATDVLSFPQKDGIEIPGWDNEPCGHQIPRSDDNASYPDIETAEENSKYYAGDIVISLETVEKNSNYFNVDKNEELIRLLIHGILHLYGMTHESNDPDQEMLMKQEELLKTITGADIF